MRYPLLMNPAFKDYLWGGTRLKSDFGKQATCDPVAESWEVSCHPDGPSTVANGPLAGRTLASILEERPEWAGAGRGGEFPILIKLIDARDRLSIQVHPDNDYARRAENQQGKNEMWYVLEAAPGAELLLGFDRPAARDELGERIAGGTLLEIVSAVPVRAGDCFSIPAGMLHAIGAGVLIAEIQQNSNVTYRVFDYGRRGADGKLRPLHVDKALDVINTGLTAVNAAQTAVAEKLDGCTVTRLTSWQYFRTDLLELTGSSTFFTGCDESGCHCLLVAEGAVEILWGGNCRLRLNRGQSAFIPAGMGTYALEGAGRLLLTTL